MMSALVLVSRFPVGSSARRTAGSLMSARAMATRCCWPPESSFGLWSVRSPKPTSSSAATARARALACADARVKERKRDVLNRIRTGEQVEALEHEAEFAQADLRERVVVEIRNVLAVEHVRPVVARSRQPMMFISVDLPEPDGPMIATYSPCRTSRSMPCSTGTSSAAVLVGFRDVAQRDRRAIVIHSVVPRSGSSFAAR